MLCNRVSFYWARPLLHPPPTPTNSDESFIVGVVTELRFNVPVNNISISSEFVEPLPGPEVIKLFPCSTQLSMTFFLLINVKMLIWAWKKAEFHDILYLWAFESSCSAELSLKKCYYLGAWPEINDTRSCYSYQQLCHIVTRQPTHLYRFENWTKKNRNINKYNS